MIAKKRLKIDWLFIANKQLPLIDYYQQHQLLQNVNGNRQPYPKSVKK